MINHEKKLKKQQCLLEGKMAAYKEATKEWYSQSKEDRTYTSDSGLSWVLPITEDPRYYGLTEEELQLCQEIETQTKKKKGTSRQHVAFMNNNYDHVIMLELGFSNAKREQMHNLDWIVKTMTEALKDTFEDYLGKIEVSPKGLIHGHFIVATNEHLNTREITRNGRKQTQVLNVKKLKETWYGETDINGQPTKYGIYDMILIENKETWNMNTCTNYVLKTLNTIENYITKNEEESPTYQENVDLDFVREVNSRSIIVKRNTPFTKWLKDYKEENRYIKAKAKVFDTQFWDSNKFSSKETWREWARQNIDATYKLANGEVKRIFENDFKLVEQNNYLHY